MSTHIGPQQCECSIFMQSYGMYCSTYIPPCMQILTDDTTVMVTFRTDILSIHKDCANQAMMVNRVIVDDRGNHIVPHKSGWDK